MATIQKFEDLRVWQKARELAKEVYTVSGRGGFAKDFSLRDQIRDAAGSVMHITAEGFDSGYDKEFIRFLRMARRSATEVQSELYIALDQRYITPTDFTRIYDMAEDCKRSINSLITYLKRERAVG